MVVHGLVHVPVPSPSGHAVLTLPILVPLSDLLGLSRQVTVLAYQYGGGLCGVPPPPHRAPGAVPPPPRRRNQTLPQFPVPPFRMLLLLRAAAAPPGPAGRRR